jgi:hypothetical protein
MQTITLDLDRVKDIRVGDNNSLIKGSIPDSGGKTSPAFVITVSGPNGKPKSFRVSVTEMNFVKVTRID